MKRKIMILAVLVICIALFAAGTLAYYTSEQKAHNVITTGGVEIALNEWADEERETPFEDLTGIMPGAAVTKIVEVENTGASTAWVRVLVDENIELSGEGRADPGDIVLDINTTDWTLKDGRYYYNSPLEAGETTAPLFTSVSFDKDMGNEYQNATVTVDVSAQAVQTANNGTSALDASGWPA